MTITKAEIAELERLCEAAGQDWGADGDLIWTADAVQVGEQEWEQQRTVVGGGPPALLALFEAARTALPKLLAEVKAVQWRTMDSAPTGREGQTIDLWVADERVTDCHYHQGAWLVWSVTTGTWVNVENIYGGPATHWQPLPAPPQED